MNDVRLDRVPYALLALPLRLGAARGLPDQRSPAE
jgi:hypothetical protein